MVTVPAIVWRGGFFSRALVIGGSVGVVLGALAWIDSGFLLGGVLVLLIVGLFYGIWMPRRMARYWPGATQLTGDERVTVVRTARRGERVEGVRRAQAVVDYCDGLRAAAEKARPLRWLLIFVLVVAVATAVWDAVYGSWGNAVASGIYLVALIMELFWWPRYQHQLLSNAGRAEKLAKQQLAEPA